MNIQKIYNKVSASAKALMLAALLSLSGSAMAQQTYVLKGRVVNSAGEPIVGAVVNVAEESRIALTDKDGYFSLVKVAKTDEVCVSCLGYQNAQEKVTAFDGSYVITMKEE